VKPVIFAARPLQARNEAAADRIGNDRENDGDGTRLLHQRRCGGRGWRQDKIRLERDEFLREALYRFACSPANVESDVVILPPPKVLEFRAKLRDPGLRFRDTLGIRHQHADPVHAPGLLRLYRERPNGRGAAKQCDEVAAFHSITSSARNKSDVGMEIPSA
jgi:hypothetical protein